MYIKYVSLYCTLLRDSDDDNDDNGFRSESYKPDHRTRGYMQSEDSIRVQRDSKWADEAMKMRWELRTRRTKCLFKRIKFLKYHLNIQSIKMSNKCAFCPKFDTLLDLVRWSLSLLGVLSKLTQPQPAEGGWNCGGSVELTWCDIHS